MSSSSRLEEVFTQRRKRGDGRTEKEELAKRWENEALKPSPLLKLVAVVESAVLSAHCRRRRRMCAEVRSQDSDGRNNQAISGGVGGCGCGGGSW
nr:hypothetical protein Iba_chr04aCG17690 [Ipomoea batatas]GMC95583.1 hypothetical protein Iba_chr05cCG9960 [Ipomoea batatas]GMD84623.1 hypothetical protein Iba_chr14aCG16530 [Ipomoea batatas]